MKKLNVKSLVFLSLALISIAGIAIMRARGADLENLLGERDRLLVFVQRNVFAAAASFILLYILVVAFSIPGATALTLLGGFFFGPLVGVVLVNIGATIGAFLVFLAARYLMRDALMDRYGGHLARLNRELERNGANYLLTLRFIPLFPFFLVNLLAGLTQVSAFTYLWTTAIGIIPGSFVYALLGSSGATMASSEGAFSPRLIGGLIALGLVSLIPVAIRKRNRRREEV